MLSKRIGYSPDHRKGRMNDQILEVLDWLQERDAIYINTVEFPLHDRDVKDGKKKIKRNDCFVVQVNNESELFNPDDTFVFLTETEFNTITQKVTTYDKQDILNVYLNIKKYINFDSYSVQLCYPSHTTISKDCGLSRGGINNIISELTALGLLYTYNSGRFEDSNGKIRYANNFYAIIDGVLNPEVCDEIIRNYYSSQGITIKNFIKDKENK